MLRHERSLKRAVLALMLTGGMLPSPSAATYAAAPNYATARARVSTWTTGGSSSSIAVKLLYHGRAPILEPPVSDGEHTFHIRVLSSEGALLHEETITAEVRGGEYDLLLGSSTPLSSDIPANSSVSLEIDGRPIANDPNGDVAGKFATYVMIHDAQLPAAVEQYENPIYLPLDNEQISAQMAERIARQRGILIDPHYSVMPVLPFHSVLHGMYLEMSLAPPAENAPHDPYQLAKYGRISLEYNNVAFIDGNSYGLAAQALHVAHHLLFYSAGLSSDINNDGMFLMTAGLAHYQTGNSRLEPFVDAPFMRFKFQSSREVVFAYSELEATMHFRSYVSGTAGLGLRLTPDMQVIGGFHHTEFVMPTEKTTRIVEGIQGIVTFGF